jgi:protein-S-isoprenylcysteine O-methyltransferase Ste14
MSVPTEERELRARFGDAWARYAGLTRQFIA